MNQTRETVNERLTNLETAHEQPTAEQPPLQPYTRRNTQNNAQNNASDPCEQYLKSIKLDIPTYDGRLNPNFF